MQPWGCTLRLFHVSCSEARDFVSAEKYYERCGCAVCHVHLPLGVLMLCSKSSVFCLLPMDGFGVPACVQQLPDTNMSQRH